MTPKTIDELYAANDAIRAEFKAAVSSLDPVDAECRPSEENWTINEIVEHTAVVYSGIVKICDRLLALAEAESAAGDGYARLSDNFVQSAAEARDRRLTAPEIVQPTGKFSISESLAQMDSGRQKMELLRERFRTFDGSRHTFPHPVFGEINAYDWLTLAGGHEMRHLEQIRRLCSQIRNASAGN